MRCLLPFRATTAHFLSGIPSTTAMAVADPSSGIKLSDEDLMDNTARRPQKRLSSPERWEAQQLIHAGVLDVRAHFKNG